MSSDSRSAATAFTPFNCNVLVTVAGFARVEQTSYLTASGVGVRVDPGSCCWCECCSSCKVRGVIHMARTRKKASGKVKTKNKEAFTQGRCSLALPMHVYIGLAIPEQAKKDLGKPGRKLLLNQLRALANDLRALSNLLAETSDDIAGGSVQSTCNSVDLLEGFEIVSEGDDTKQMLQQQGRFSLSLFPLKTVLRAIPDCEEDRALVKKNTHVIKSTNCKLDYILSTKDTCSSTARARRTWSKHSKRVVFLIFLTS